MFGRFLTAGFAALSLIGVAHAAPARLAPGGKRRSMPLCMMQTYLDDGLTIIVLTSTDGAAHPLRTKVAKILAP
jgi:hypothetical protein